MGSVSLTSSEHKLMDINRVVVVKSFLEFQLHRENSTSQCLGNFCSASMTRLKMPFLRSSFLVSKEGSISMKSQ